DIPSFSRPPAKPPDGNIGILNVKVMGDISEHKVPMPRLILILFDEFAGELTLLKTIPSGINETDCDPEEETHFIKILLYDNSSPHPPDKFSDAAIESFSPFPSPLKIITLLWKKLIYLLLRMTQFHRALRKMTMTLKGIF
nr:hypothetical protein [Tanacetum cinerariifolium]